MTNQQLHQKLRDLIQGERAITNDILKLINIGFQRRAYLELGYSSMFDWLVKGFGYSASAAYRRISAAKLMHCVPHLEHKLASGEVSLSNVSKAQSVIRAQEKVTGRKVAIKDKERAIAQISQQPAHVAEQVLFSLFPESAEVVNQDRKVVINENVVRHHVNLSVHTSRDLAKAKEVLSHKFPEAKDSDILSYALKFLLDRVDPLRKAQKLKHQKLGAHSQSITRDGSAAVPVCGKSSRAAIRGTVIQDSNASCTFKNPQTGEVCGSRYQVQIDHIIPKSLGGTDEPDNLRALCRNHNLHAAEKLLGKKLMEKYRRRDE